MAKKKNKNKKNKEKEQKDMNENLLYEVKFYETEDGYRLEASGDKALLRRLGIGPRMLGGRKRPNRHSNKRRMGRRRAAPSAPDHLPAYGRGVHQRRRRGARHTSYNSLAHWKHWPRNHRRWDDAPDSNLF